MSALAKPFTLHSYRALMTDPDQPVPWIIHDLMTQGEKVLIYGEWGSLKSWLLIALVLALATGRPWLNAFPVPRPLKVLYIDAEMSKRRFRKRLRQVAQGMGVSLDADLPLRYICREHIKLGSSRLSHPITSNAAAQSGQRVLDRLNLADFNPDVIIIETLRRTLIGSEKEAEDIGAFWEAIDVLVGEEQRTVIVSHHMRKRKSKGESTRDRASGSTDLQAGCDNAIAIALTGESGVVHVIQEKMREQEEVPPFTVAMRGEPDQPVTFLCSRSAGVPTLPPPVVSVEERVERAIRDLGLIPRLSDRLTRKNVEAHLHGLSLTFSRATLTRVLRKLCQDGVLQRAARGTYTLGSLGSRPENTLVEPTEHTIHSAPAIPLHQAGDGEGSKDHCAHVPIGAEP